MVGVRRLKLINTSRYDDILLNVLKSAYLYYWGINSESSMADLEYDFQTRKLAKWYESDKIEGGKGDIHSKIQHPAKELIDWEALKTSSSLHYIPIAKFAELFPEVEL